LLGITQKELAKRLKIDPSTLGQWEKGKGKPSKKISEKLVGFFASLPSNSLRPEE
jgi:transcriptional regulator with XRE-family HTH domain